MGGDDNGEFDSSPGTSPGVRVPSAQAVRFADIAALLNSLATEYQQAATRVDQLEGDERRVYAERLARDGRATARAIKANAVELAAEVKLTNGR